MAEIPKSIEPESWKIGYNVALQHASAHLRSLASWDLPTSGTLTPDEAARYIDRMPRLVLADAPSTQEADALSRLVVDMAARGTLSEPESRKDANA